MLNFRTASALLVVFAVTALLLTALDPEFAWILAALVFFYLLVVIMGVVRICMNFFIPAECAGKTMDKIAALSFDDGPDANCTPEILAILEKYQVPAAFFVIGHKAEKLPGLLQKMAATGHQVGNHSYSHAFFFDLFGRKKMERDLLTAREVIREATGKMPVRFRPPYGVTNPVLAGVVKKLGFRVTGWSVRSFDTTASRPEQIVNRIARRLHPGAVILLHDDREITARTLEQVILHIRKEGYRLVSLDELLN